MANNAAPYCVKNVATGEILISSKKRGAVTIKQSFFKTRQDAKKFRDETFSENGILCVVSRSVHHSAGESFPDRPISSEYVGKKRRKLLSADLEIQQRLC